MFIEPVFGKKFFGREEVLAVLQKRTSALKGGYRQNLALTGPMLSGKSSVLRHFLRGVKDPDIIPIYVEMGDEDFKMFCTRFMATLLYRFLLSTGKKCKDDFEELKTNCRELIPDTVRCVEEVSKALKRRKDEEAYEKLLSLTSIFKDESGKSCIVILDEFHNLANFSLKRPFQTFGKYIMIQKNTMYIVSSSQKTLLKEILSKKLSLLFGNFEVVEVNGFDNETARSFVSEKIEDSPCSDEIKNYIMQVSQGSPFYLEILSARYSDVLRSKKDSVSDRECLLSAFAGLLYASDGILNQYFTNHINFFLEKKSRRKFIHVLVSMARGCSTIKSIQSDFGKVDKDLSGKLQKLQNMDLIYNSGIFYKVSDKLFEYWLKYVYSIKGQSMIDDMDIKYLEFKRSLGEDLDAFCSFNSKSLEDIISGLFRSFKGEKVRVSMKDRKMPKFDSLETTGLSENIFQVAGLIGNKKWICHVKSCDLADEQDINDLVEVRSGKDKKNILRKIFIPLKGIEQNAFLLAKEQNVWVWDMRQLNKMLRLFGEFELVI